MQSLKIGNGTAIHIRDERYTHLAPLCGGTRTNGPAQAKRVVEGVPTCKSCLKALAKIQAEFHATPITEAPAETAAEREEKWEEAQEEYDNEVAQAAASQEREQVARTLPDGDLAYWIANPKTEQTEPEQHAAFVAEKARRDQEKASCPNPWHQSALARKLQSCPECAPKGPRLNGPTDAQRTETLRSALEALTACTELFLRGTRDYRDLRNAVNSANAALENDSTR